MSRLGSKGGKKEVRLAKWLIAPEKFIIQPFRIVLLCCVVSMFIVKCSTCQEASSFGDYTEANGWRRKHTTDGHLVEIIYKSDRVYVKR